MTLEVVTKLAASLNWEDAAVTRNMVHSVSVTVLDLNSQIDHCPILRGVNVSLQSGVHSVEEIVRASQNLTSALALSPDRKVYCAEYTGHVDLEPFGVIVAGHILSSARVGSVYDHQKQIVGKYLHIGAPSASFVKMLIVLTQEANKG